MFNVGDYVTRKKYNHDIVFKIKEIINNKVILHGVDVRICADCNKDDLEKVIYKKKLNRISNIKEIVKNDYDLSINKYKEIVVEKKEYEKPQVILKRVIEMESEIQQKLKELEELL